MIGRKELSETLGLSCVEKYFLAWLSERYEVRKLYGSGFIGLGQVFDDFRHGATYENYCALPRLQDVAEEYGIVRHEFLPCKARSAMEVLRKKPEEALCLIRVNTRFFLNFKRSSWREDHYVCVDKNLHWLNEYPLSEGDFTEEKFAEVYDGAMCVYEASDLTAEPPDEMTEKIAGQDFGELPELKVNSFEGAVGVLRATRRRMREYYASERVKELLSEEIGILDKLYVRAHLRQLRSESGCHTEYKHFAREEELLEVAEREKQIAEALYDERTTDGKD